MRDGWSMVQSTRHRHKQAREVDDSPYLCPKALVRSREKIPTVHCIDSVRGRGDMRGVGGRKITVSIGKELGGTLGSDKRQCRQT